MQYTGMIWLFGIALMKKQTTLSFRTIMPIATVILGVVMFMISGSSGAYSAAGMLAAISESLFFAGITFFAKDAGNENPLALTSIANLLTAAFVFILPSTAIADIGTISGTNWLLLLFLGTFQLGAGYSLYNIGLKHVLPHKASMIAIWEMILGPVWCLIFLGEVPAVMVVVGFMLILAGMLADGIMAGMKAADGQVFGTEERAADHGLRLVGAEENKVREAGAARR
jgi:drug/metabolite transporter (DMT)-like permease